MIAIFYHKKKNQYEYSRLMEEAKKYNNIKVVDFSEFDWDLEDFHYDSVKLTYFYSTSNAKIDAHLLARELEKQGIKVINHNLVWLPVYEKNIVYYLLKKKKIPIPRIVKILDPSKINRVKKLGFPLVAKHSLKHLGKGVYLIRNEEELEKFIQENEHRLPFIIFQEYIEYKHDLRVILIGDKVLGAMERIPINDFRANISLGNIGRPFEVNKEIEELCFKVSEALDVQIAGIDILIDKEGNYYVIDVNKEMQFQGFEKYVRKNVAKEIIEYLIRSAST